MRFVVIALLILLILVFLAVFIHFKKKLSGRRNNMEEIKEALMLWS